MGGKGADLHVHELVLRFAANRDRVSAFLEGSHECLRIFRVGYGGNLHHALHRYAGLG